MTGGDRAASSGSRKAVWKACERPQNWLASDIVHTRASYFVMLCIRVERADLQWACSKFWLALSMPSVQCRDSTPVESFAERLRRQDEAFRAALDNKAFETGIREVKGDAADDALRRLLDARDQAQASH